MSKRKTIETSLDAYRSLDPVKINDIHKRIIVALEVVGSGTYEDLATYLSIEPQRVWRRLSELHKANLIHRPGDRKTMKSGRQGFIWRLGASPEPIKKRERVMKGKTVAQYAKDILSIHGQERLF